MDGFCGDKSSEIFFEGGNGFEGIMQRLIVRNEPFSSNFLLSLQTPYFLTSNKQTMVQNTKTIPTIEEDTSTPKAETKTISISVQISYEQILDLALQLAKAEKEALMEALGESLEKEKVKQELIEEQQGTVKKDGKEEKQAYQSWLDKDFYNFDSTTVDKINSGEVEPKSVGSEHIKKLYEQFREGIEAEGPCEDDDNPNPIL